MKDIIENKFIKHMAVGCSYLVFVDGLEDSISGELKDKDNQSICMLGGYFSDTATPNQHWYINANRIIAYVDLGRR